MQATGSAYMPILRRDATPSPTPSPKWVKGSGVTEPLEPLLSLAGCQDYAIGLSVRSAYYSTDGVRWTKVRHDFEGDVVNAAVTEDCASAYVTGWGTGVWKSAPRLDGPWTRLTAGLPDRWLQPIAIAGDTVLVGATLSTNGSGGVYRLHGDTWQRLGVDRLDTRALLIDRGIYYVGTSSGVFRFDLDMDQWREYGPELRGQKVRAMLPGWSVSGPGVDLVGTDDGLRQLDLVQLEWRRAPGAEAINTRVYSLVQDRDTRYAAVKGSGIWKNDRGQAVWQLFEPIPGQGPADPRAMILFRDRLLVAATDGVWYYTESAP